MFSSLCFNVACRPHSTARTLVLAPTSRGGFGAPLSPSVFRGFQFSSGSLNASQYRRVFMPSSASPSAAAPGQSSGEVALEPTSDVLAVWRSSDAVAFDVDSTLCSDESIDEVAAFLGCGEEIAELTTKAMGGNVSFQDALKQRLDIMQVSSEQMKAFLDSHPPQLSPGIEDLVSKLHAQGKKVYLVSGGFRQIIEPIAKLLNIPKSRIFANSILYNPDGSYAGFDTEEFTSRSGGKPAALRYIKESDGCKSIVMVGDGATDMEARKEGVADLFIGYGGVVMRENIATMADWYVYNFDGLLQALEPAN